MPIAQTEGFTPLRRTSTSSSGEQPTGTPTSSGWMKSSPRPCSFLSRWFHDVSFTSSSGGAPSPPVRATAGPAHACCASCARRSRWFVSAVTPPPVHPPRKNAVGLRSAHGSCTTGHGSCSCSSGQRHRTTHTERQARNARCTVLVWRVCSAPQLHGERQALLRAANLPARHKGTRNNGLVPPPRSGSLS